MEKSQNIVEISKALLKFQTKIATISKDAKNPFFKSSYATLSSIQDAIKKPLTECGLTYSQFPDGEDSLTTILIHADSGQYFQSTNKMKPVKSDPQALGSAITYNRRYCLTSILGLNIDEDDDGNKGSNQKEVVKEKKIVEIMDKDKNFTALWLQLKTAAIEGKIKSIEQVKEHYTIGKQAELELKKLIK